ncbi:MAG: cytochrome c-type biogenesis protein CcmH [Thiobacillaceae bacterium]
MRRVLALAILLGTLASPALAGEARPNAENPEIEARLNRLAEDLRCLVCQNESLAGSRADLAEDLRREIREQMRQGKSDQEVIQYLTDRYGDFVLYRPPLKPVTYLLWGAPVLFLLIGGTAWYVVLRRRRSLKAEQLVNPDELQRAARLLESE